MNRRFIKHTVLFGLLFYVLFQCFNGVIFILSHLPPAFVHLDWFLLRLGEIARIFTWPRRLLRHLWPWETTPTALNYFLSIVNWLLWGMLVAGWKALRARSRN